MKKNAEKIINGAFYKGSVIKFVSRRVLTNVLHIVLFLHARKSFIFPFASQSR